MIWSFLCSLTFVSASLVYFFYWVLSIMVSRLRLLWTLEIRDSIFSIVKDLIYTLGFMKSQKRQLHLLLGLPPEDEDQEFNDSSPIEEEGFELSLHDERKKDRRSSALHESMLAYLLEEPIYNVDVISAPSEEKSEYNDTAKQTEQSEQKEKEGKTLPTLDVHLSNPQIQLHSTATGGSIVLAMEGAHVEGRKFVHFIVANAHNKTGKLSPSDLLRKTGMIGCFSIFLFCLHRPVSLLCYSENRACLQTAKPRGILP